MCSFPVYLQNDATAACGAELVFGQTGNLRDFIYFYIGAFAGGGIVLNGRLYSGPTGNAGALGSMPVPGADGRPTQLIDVASLAILEKALNARGADASYLWTTPEDWIGDGAGIRRLVCGGRRRARLCDRRRPPRSSTSRRRSSTAGCRPPRGSGWSSAVQQALARIDVEGLKIPAVREGTVGIHARALGGASLPLSERFLIGAATAAKGLRMLIGIPALLGPDFWRRCAPWAMATNLPSSTGTIRRQRMDGAWCAPTATG